MITKKELAKKINVLLKKKNYKDDDYDMFELYIQLYLILDKRRKLAQIATSRNPDENLYKKMIRFLKKNYPYYVMRNDDRAILLYDSKYPIQKMNETYSKRFAEDLGDFYVCAGNLDKIDKKNKYLLRPSIDISYRNKNGKWIDTEIFGQMCPPSKCISNLKKFYKIVKQFQKYLMKINKNIRVKLGMSVFSSQH
jgi:hypothetical protein